ncbi:unnamed protein product [Lathyrus oleraceus]
MRPLDESETSFVLEKLFKFVGNNLKNLVPNHEGPDSNPIVATVSVSTRTRTRSTTAASRSSSEPPISLDLISFHSCIRKYTHAGNFHLTVQAPNLLAANAKLKVWLKPQSEMSFLLHRIIENIVAGDGAIVFNMADVSLGFEVAAKSTQYTGS